MNAYIFGNLVVQIQNMNRKMQMFYEKLDITNTTMRNMKLSNEMQLQVREFFMKTQSGLDSQNELTRFLRFIPPSLRSQVIKFLFSNSAINNPILSKSPNFNVMID